MGLMFRGCIILIEVSCGKREPFAFNFVRKEDLVVERLIAKKRVFGSNCGDRHTASLAFS